MKVSLYTYSQPMMILQHIRNTFCLKLMHNCSIIELQNHRMYEAERDLWTSSDPTLLQKQGHLHPVAWDYVHMALEYP